MQRVSLSVGQSRPSQIKSPLIQKDKPKIFNSKDGTVTIERLPIYDINKFAIKVAKKVSQRVTVINKISAKNFPLRALKRIHFTLVNPIDVFAIDLSNISQSINVTYL